MQERLGRARVQGYLAHKKLRPPLGSPQGPGHSPTVGSWEENVSYERGTPVEGAFSARGALVFSACS